MAMYKKVEKVGEYKGYAYAVVYRDFWRCGYVIADKYPSTDNIECHGGITYEGSASVIYPKLADKKCLGFDCNHVWDRHDWDACEEYFGEHVSRQFEKNHIDASLSFYSPSLMTLNDCIEQCKEIIDQIIEGGKDEINRKENNTKPF